MPTVIGTSLPVIVQAVEQQLLTYTSPITGEKVAGDISNIYWVEQGDTPIPGLTGQRDILIAEHFDDTLNTSIIGASIFTEIDSAIDVYLRSSLASDSNSTRKDWFIAHRLLVDALMDALMGFFPEDSSHNALTVYGLRFRSNATPVRNRDSMTWGFTVGTYDLRYTPNVSLTPIR